MVKIKRRMTDKPSRPTFSPPVSRRQRRHTTSRGVAASASAGVRLPDLNRKIPRAFPGQMAGLENIKVEIDYRRGSKELLSYPPFDKIGVEADLKSGDVAFVGYGPTRLVSVGIEVKSIHDLVSSLDNGRIQGTQIPRMLDEYDVVHLIYYGQFRRAPGSNCLQIWKKGEFRNYYLGTRPVSYGYIQGFILGLAELGVDVIRVADMAEVAAELETIVRWRNKPYEKHKSLLKLDRSRTGGKKKRGEKGEDKEAARAALMPRLDERTEMMAKTAMAWPGLGYERALIAAKHFDTVTEMVNAPKEVWANLKTKDRKTGREVRFGPVVAEAVVEALNWRRRGKAVS